MYTENSKIVGFGPDIESEIDIEELYTAPDSVHVFNACEGYALESLGALLESSDNVADDVVASICKHLDTIDHEEALEAYASKFENIKKVFSDPVNKINEINNTMEPGTEAYVEAMESALTQIAFVKNMLGIGEKESCTAKHIKMCGDTLKAIEGLITERAKTIAKKIGKKSFFDFDSFYSAAKADIDKCKHEYSIDKGMCHMEDWNPNEYSLNKVIDANINECEGLISKREKDMNIVSKIKNILEVLKNKLEQFGKSLSDGRAKHTISLRVSEINLATESFNLEEYDFDIATEGRHEKDIDNPPKEGIEDDRVMKPVDHDILTKKEFALAINVAQHFDKKEEKGESVPSLGKGVKWKDVVLGIHKGHYTVNALCDLAGGNVFCRGKDKKLALIEGSEASEMFKLNGSYIVNDEADLDENGKPRYEAMVKADKYAKESYAKDDEESDESLVKRIERNIADIKRMISSKNFDSAEQTEFNTRGLIANIKDEDVRKTMDQKLDQTARTLLQKNDMGISAASELPGSKAISKKNVEEYIAKAKKLFDKEKYNEAYLELTNAYRELGKLGDSAGVDSLMNKWELLNDQVANMLKSKGLKIKKASEGFDHIDDDMDDVSVNYDDDDNDPDIAALEGLENIIAVMDPELISALESFSESELIDLEVALESIEGMTDEEIAAYIAEEGVTDKVKGVIENIQTKRHAKKHGVSLDIAKIERAYETVGKAVKAFDHPLKTKNIMIMQTAFKVLASIGGILAAGSVGYSLVKKATNAAKSVDNAKNAIAALKTETAAAAVDNTDEKIVKEVEKLLSNDFRHSQMKMLGIAPEDLAKKHIEDLTTELGRQQTYLDRLYAVEKEVNANKALFGKAVALNKAIDETKSSIKTVRKAIIGKEGYEADEYTEDSIAYENAAVVAETAAEVAAPSLFASITANLTALSGSTYIGIAALGAGVAGSAIAKKLGGSEAQEKEIKTTVDSYQQTLATVHQIYKDLGEELKAIKAKGDPVDPNEAHAFASKCRKAVNRITGEYRALNAVLKTLIKNAKRSGNTLADEEKFMTGGTASFSEIEEGEFMEPSYESYYEGYNNIYCYLDNEELEGLESYTNEELFDLEMALEALLFTDMETEDIVNMIAEEGKLKDKIEEIAAKRQAKKTKVSLSMAKIDRMYTALEKALKEFEHPLNSDTYKHAKKYFKIMSVISGISFFTGLAARIFIPEIDIPMSAITADARSFTRRSIAHSILNKSEEKLKEQEERIKKSVDQYNDAYEKCKKKFDEIAEVYREIKQKGDPVDATAYTEFIKKSKSALTDITNEYNKLYRTLTSIVKSAKKNKTSIEEEAKIHKKLATTAMASLSNACIIEELEMIHDDLFLDGEWLNATEAYERLTEVSEAMEALLGVIHTIEDPDERLNILDWYAAQRPNVLTAIESLTDISETSDETDIIEEDVVDEPVLPTEEETEINEEAEESFVDITDFEYLYDPAVEAAMADTKDSWVINYNSLHAQIVNGINTASQHIKSHSIKEAKDSLNTAAHACRETLGNIKELTKEKFRKFSKRTEVSDESFETFRKLKTQEITRILDKIKDMREKIGDKKAEESFVNEAYNEYLLSLGMDEDGNLIDVDAEMNAAIEAKVELESQRFDAMCNLELAMMELNSEECP